MAWWRRDHQRAGHKSSSLSGRAPTARRFAWSGAAAVTALLGAALLWHTAETQLRQYAAHLDRAPLTWQEIHLVDTPAWMGSSVQRQLQKIVATSCGSSILDQESLNSAATQLHLAAWTETVQQVRRAANGKIHVHARYRQPVAVVQTNDGYRIIDVHGILLPGLYLKHALPELGMPLIVGVRSTPGPTGMPWRGPDLRAGIELVRVLEGDPLLKQITAIDVGVRDARRRVHVVLRTTSGFVRWGLPPSESYPIEPDAGIKRQLLRRVASEYGGRIDAGGRIVDIYDGEIYLHPPTQHNTLPAGYTSMK